MNQSSIPARITLPGYILNRELGERGWNVQTFSELANLSGSTVNAIIAGNQEITLEIAITIGQALETSSELWVNLETNYRSSLLQPSQLTELAASA
jgi:plasmid maintenance system antidote protein VapI